MGARTAGILLALGLLPAVVVQACGGAAGRWVAFEPAGEGYRSAPLPMPPQVSMSRLLTADLDADGRPEGVRWEGERLYIEREGEVVWESEAEWLVVDVAVGDAWNDLRQEVVMALWKDDPAGIPRSHPFIMGHRHGRYDLLWGGSAAAAPIRDLDLGDVDGDGQNELVVLEGDYGEAEGAPARYVTVWRWNGWGFTLLWRSEAGHFRHLLLGDIDGDGAAEIMVQEF